MYRIKSIEEVFCPFSLDKTTLSIIHIQRNESKAGLPFIDQPAASNHSLGRLMRMQPVHDQKKYKALISVVRFEKAGDCQKNQHADKLHGSIFLKVLDQAECQVAQKQGEKYILLIRVQQGAVLREVPWNLGNTGENQKISSILKPIVCMKESLHKQETENGKGSPAYVAHDPVQGVGCVPNLKPGCDGWRIVAQKKRGGMVDEHDHHSQHLQGASTQDPELFGHKRS